MKFSPDGILEVFVAEDAQSERDFLVAAGLVPQYGVQGRVHRVDERRGQHVPRVALERRAVASQAPQRRNLEIDRTILFWQHFKKILADEKFMDSKKNYKKIQIAPQCTEVQIGLLSCKGFFLCFFVCCCFFQNLVFLYFLLLTPCSEFMHLFFHAANT